MQADDMLSQIEEHFHVLSLGEKSLDFGKILSTDTSVKILEAVYNSDHAVGASAPEISEVLGVGRTTVIYHLGRMLESGLVKINPVLKTEEDWKRFWNHYRNRDTDVTREQFNQVHDARMNGVKLFVPTKKGFLVLPSTDVKESRSMVKEVLASITTLAVEGDYKKLKKTTSLLGTVGALLIAISFLFQLPFLQQSQLGMASVALEGKSMTGGEEFAAGGSPATAPTATTPPVVALAESVAAEKSASAPSAEDSAEKSDLAVEEGQRLDVKRSEEASETVVSSTVQSVSATADKGALTFNAVMLVGTLFVGSFFGFLVYSYIRKK
jgi:DNA-binding transcriptional ArsR family regulator